MRERLPQPSAKHYERPNQPWVCGLASEGLACPAGPSGRGECPALAECAPNRDGDRWQCNRSALRGGPCENGPSPDGKCERVHRCQPVRSLRSMRGRFVAACSLLVSGALIVMLSADWRDEAINPGPLADQHAELLNPASHGTMAASCAACHAAAEGGALDWTASLLSVPGDGPTQSDQCMNCHKDSISPETALAAHNLPPEALRRITAARSDDDRHPKLSLLLNIAPPTGGGVACAACHREHQGADFDLTAMSNASCQACHQQQYESFAADHPDFGGWPYERRTRIAFDHVSHSAKHFSEKKQPFDCRACHVEDATQTVQLLTGFETACASCHAEKIEISVGRGVPMLALPTLDVEALRDAGHDIGPWPEAATGDFDGRLPPVMKLLLAADPSAEHAMMVLGPDFEFLDVDPEDELHLAACAELALAIKKLVADLGERGQEAVRERLRWVLDANRRDEQLASITAGMSNDTVRSVAAAWLVDIPSAPEKTQDDAASQPPPKSRTGFRLEEIEKPDGNLAFDPAGAWFYEDATFTVYYRPAGHADPVLAGWLDALAGTPAIERQPLEFAMLKELSKPTAPGLCASCHSVERHGLASQERLLVNWRAYDGSAKSRSFTKFSHGPHVMLPQLADCTQCHAMRSTSGTLTSYAEWNPRHSSSEFQPMSKQACAQCHTAKAAGDRCQQCHNYHVDAVERSSVR